VSVLVDTPVWSLALRRRARQLSPAERQVDECAARHGLAIFTTDTDFTRYAAVLPLRLHRPSEVRHG
jgi:predicted nucleic acid-binding protein